jgi:hypothetical protein
MLRVQAQEGKLKAFVNEIEKCVKVSLIKLMLYFEQTKLQ